MTRKSELASPLPPVVQKVSNNLQRWGFWSFWLQLVLGIISTVTLLFSTPALFNPIQCSYSSVGRTEDVSQFSSCRVCDALNANTLHHYCLESPALTHLLPHRQSVLDVCKHLLTGDNLELLLLQQPRFGGCY